MVIEEKAHRLVLASSSPRRRELLTSAGYQFEVIPPDESAETEIYSGETPTEYVVRLAYQKAENVAKNYDSGLFIGCDTVGEVLGKVLGKPRNESHAEEMLRLMSGREHRVLSGICLWSRPENKTVVSVEVTQLMMDQLSDQWLEKYLATDQWIGKAGAFGFQDGLDWIKIIDGSESNVVGLPLEALAKMLLEF